MFYRILHIILIIEALLLRNRDKDNGSQLLYQINTIFFSSKIG